MLFVRDANEKESYQCRNLGGLVTEYQELGAITGRIVPGTGMNTIVMKRPYRKYTSPETEQQYNKEENMFDFLLDIAKTWCHIAIGLSLVGALLLTSYYLSGVYNRYIEKRDSSEYQKIKEAFNK